MASKDISSKLTAQWSSTVKNITVSDWERLFGSSNIKSHRFFQATEASNFNEITYHYLSIDYNGKIIVMAACFTYYLDLTDLLTDKISKYIIKQIRKISGSFGKFKLLVIGSYPATCEHFIEMDNTIDKEVQREVSLLINKELELKRKEQRCSLIMVKDVRTKYVKEVKHILSKDFHFFSSFPTTFFPLEETLPFPSALNKKKQKRRYYKHKEFFDASYKWETITNFKDYTNILYELYRDLLSRAKNKFEILNEDFFKNINTHFPEESFLLVAKNKSNNKIEIIEIVLKEKDRLLPLYLGTSKTENTEKTLSLYLNAIFEPIKQAEKMKGMDLVEFGQTSYYPKVLSGALVEDLSYGFYSHHFIMKRVIKYLFKYIFTPERVPKHAYSYTHLGKIKEIARKKEMEVINF